MMAQPSPSKFMTYLATATILFVPLLAFLFLREYTNRFGYSANVQQIGLAIVVLGMAWIFFAALLIELILLRRVAFYFAFPSLSLFLSSMSFIYAAAFASNLLWADTINYATMLSFVVHSSVVADAMTETYAADKSQLFGAMLCFLLAGTLIVGSAWAAATIFAEWVHRVAVSRRRLHYAGATGLCVVAAQVAVAGVFASSRDRLYGEPVFSFFNLVHVNNLSQLDNRKVVEMLKDREIRASYAHLRPQRPKNVVIIFSDSLRADHTSVYGYPRDTTPFLKKLHESKKLHRVDMALSTCSESFCGISSTLSSRPFDRIANSNFKLTDLLRVLGYQTNFFLSGDHRAWGFLKDYYGPAIDRYIDYESLGSDSLDDRPIVNALNRVDGYNGTPNLFYFFLMSTHQSGKKYPEYERYRPASRGRILFAQLTAAERQLEVNRYDNGVVQVDAYIERIFMTLKEKGYLEQSLVFILADHGEGLGEHGHYGHGRFLYQEDIRIPLLIYDSDGFSFKNSHFGTMMDVAPTIADRIGVPIPSTWKGQSLVEPAGRRYTIHQTRRAKELCSAVVESSAATLMKYMRCLSRGSLVDEYLFDLITDPGEENNLIVSGDRRAEQFRKTIDDRFGIIVGDCDGSECANAMPHMLSYGVTPSNDGSAHLTGPGSTGVFAIATTNVGIAGRLTARARLLNASLPIAAFVCETNPADATCKAPPTSSVTRMIHQGEKATWAAFLTANGPIAPDPDHARIIFEFVDASGIVRGSTSTAVTTDP